MCFTYFKTLFKKELMENLTFQRKKGFPELIPFSLVWKLPASSQVLSGVVCEMHVSIVILTCYCLSKCVVMRVYREFPTEH